MFRRIGVSQTTRVIFTINHSLIIHRPLDPTYSSNRHLLPLFSLISSDLLFDIVAGRLLLALVPFLFSAWDRQSDAPSLVTGEKVCFIHLDNACMKKY